MGTSAVRPRISATLLLQYLGGAWFNAGAWNSVALPAKSILTLLESAHESGCRISMLDRNDRSFNCGSTNQA
jgi:hypothetical protein